MDDLPLIGIVVAALVALLAGVFWFRRRRAGKVEDTLMSTAGTDASSVFGTTGGRAVDTGATSSQQTDFSQTGIGAIDTDEVDPVAEADVYMAYGRDAQAEEILKEALQKDPSKHPVRAKLLEIYAARKDVRAFETTAGELYAATQGQGPEWERAAALGAQLDPSNPMYAPAAGAHRSDEVHRDIAPSARAPEVNALPAHTTHSIREPSPPAHSIEPQLGLGDLPELTITTRAPADLGFDLNLGDTAARHENSRLDLELPETKYATEHSPAASSTAPAQAAPASRSGLDFGAINLDLGPMTTGGSMGADARWQEVATKLDLAKAYHEMGDRDGARELLGEVAKEGDAVQQQQAKKLLETIG
jgi:pilus assembly protein FimV